MLFFTINGVRQEQARRKNNKVMDGVISKIQRDQGYRVGRVKVKKHQHVAVNDVSRAIGYPSQNKDLIRSVGYRLETLWTPGGYQSCKVFNLEQLFSFLNRCRHPYAGELAAYIARRAAV